MRLRLLALLVFPVFAIVAAAQQTPSGATTFENHCSLCHGADGSGGGRAPSVLGFVRYHTDPELTAVIHDGRLLKGMPSFNLSSDELAGLVAHLRELSGSTKAMGVGGMTGEVPKRGPGRKLTTDPRPGEVRLATGGMLQGTIIESDFSAQVLTQDQKFHLLSREGGLYREKPIEPKSDWTAYNGSDSGNRYSKLSQINNSTVGGLSLAWLFPIPSSGRLETTPIVVDGIMYVTGWNELYALDATTGQQLWMYRQSHTEGLMSEAGRGTNRGVSIAGNKVFMVTDGAHLLSFNRMTGEKLWDVEMGAVKDGYSATLAPLVVGDLLIVGVSGGEEGTRGFLSAYNVDTGRLVWRFYTIPKRGEKGSETWVGNAMEHGCGATWLTGSYDPQLDLVYWATGNPCPDYNGDERKGDNLYTSSVVALSVKTGELRWHFQFTPHDTHDWDSEEPLVLIDQVWQGKPRKLMLHADRNGFFFVLDRSNGELLLAKPFAKVNWATGYGSDGRPILTDTTEASTAGTLICPASSGATNWYSSSWSPLTKLFYLRANDWCSTYKKQEDPLVGNRWYGGVAPNQTPAVSFIRALNIDTGKKVWELPLSTYGQGGILTTAGGVLFAGGPQGAFLALNAASGKEEWHINLGQNWQASPMTYMVGGGQYVALAGPGGIFAFSLPSQTK